MDNNDYDILDATNKTVYFDILDYEIKKRFDGKMLPDTNSLKTLQYNGTVKVLIFNYDYQYSLFGFSSFENDPFKNKPKYIALKDTNYLVDNIQFGYNFSYPSENKYLGEDLQNKLRQTKTVIYRWDSTENKYMFESADTLEDWLKEHPLDTL